MNKVFFTSDLHLFHKKIVEFTNRNIETSQERHEEWLIDLWNAQVHKGDLVYILGDVSFAKDADETESVLRKLNGQKFVVKGNHDKSEDLDKLVSSNAIVKWEQYKERKVNNQHICMFHFPIMSWHKQHYGSWHLHGHSHGMLKESKGKMLDAGIDSAYDIFGEHRLFSFEDVYDIMSSKELNISDEHRKVKYE